MIKNPVLIAKIMLVALFKLSVWFCGAIVLALCLQFTFHTVVPASFWVEYYKSEPARKQYHVGDNPVFFTQSIWHRKVPVEWPDIIWCAETEGHFKGIERRFKSQNVERYIRRPGIAGFYDLQGHLVNGSVSGYFDWVGYIPKRPAKCRFDPHPVIYPSWGVQKSVPIKDINIETQTFYFVDESTSILEHAE